MTSTMTPRHVPSIESLRRMPSFNSRGANASGTAADMNANTIHQWTPSLATPPNHLNANGPLTGHRHSPNSPNADAAAAALGMGIHRGAIDKTTVTTQPPARVMAHVAGVLQAMGVEIQQESTYRFRCIRPKKGGPSAGRAETLTQAQTTSGGNAASLNELQLAAPAPIPLPTSSSVASRCVSPLDDSRPLSPFDSPILHSFSGPNDGAPEVLYGSPPDDSQDEVRFSVELTKLEGLSGTYSLDVRRLKGGLRSYSFIYNTIRERASINLL